MWPIFQVLVPTLILSICFVMTGFRFCFLSLSLNLSVAFFFLFSLTTNYSWLMPMKTLRERFCHSVRFYDKYTNILDM